MTDDPDDQERRAEQARSFDSAADVYQRARPGYPDEALDWLIAPGVRRVLDLGAGTGKLTASLAARGLEVTAVEPADGMRAELERALPAVRSLAGSAEAIPLADGAVELVLVAQAWHWVDPARAVPEVARVLAPGGRLGLLWNRRDDDVPWVAEYGRLLAGGVDGLADADRAGLRAPFGELERFITARWTQELTPDGLVELAASRSYVITRGEADRRALLERVAHLAATHPDLAGRDVIEVPYRTDCLRAERLR